MIGLNEIATLERSARAALPAAEEIATGDWLIRISGGATKRINSANPIVQGARVATVVALAEETYRARSMPVRFRLSPLAEPEADAALATRGYARAEESWTMAAPTAGHVADPAVTLATRPSDEWHGAFAEVSGWSTADDASYRAILAPVERVVIATLIEDGEVLGFGLASIVDHRAWLASIATQPAARGRGVGRRLVATLLAQAAAEGASEALLQVLAANATARRLYDALGFTDVYPYHYRIADSGE